MEEGTGMMWAKSSQEKIVSQMCLREDLAGKRVQAQAVTV